MKGFGMRRIVIRGGSQLNRTAQAHGAGDTVLPQVVTTLLGAGRREGRNLPNLGQIAI